MDQKTNVNAPPLIAESLFAKVVKQSIILKFSGVGEFPKTRKNRKSRLVHSISVEKPNPLNFTPIAPTVKIKPLARKIN